MRCMSSVVGFLWCCLPACSQDAPRQQVQTPPAVDQVALLDEAFAAALPPVEESRWTLIPWRHSLTDALQEARLLQRPVYLYVNDGDVESGRC